MPSLPGSNLPSSSLSSSHSPDAAPPPVSARSLPAIALGWVLGGLLVLLVRWLGSVLLTDPCRGHVTLALLMPLLLGPGGFAFLAANWRRPRWAAIGLGFMLASLFPALYLGTQDIGHLRAVGCAGGYIIISQPDGKSTTSVALSGGQTVNLKGRLGGYTPQTHPGPFTLKAAVNSPDITVTLPAAPVRPSEEFPIQVSARPGVGMNTYTATITASGTRDGQPISTNGTLGLEIRP